MKRESEPRETQTSRKRRNSSSVGLDRATSALAIDDRVYYFVQMATALNIKLISQVQSLDRNIHVLFKLTSI